MPNNQANPYLGTDQYVRPIDTSLRLWLNRTCESEICGVTVPTGYRDWNGAQMSARQCPTLHCKPHS